MFSNFVVPGGSGSLESLVAQQQANKARHSTGVICLLGVERGREGVRGVFDVFLEIGGSSFVVYVTFV